MVLTQNSLRLLAVHTSDAIVREYFGLSLTDCGERQQVSVGLGLSASGVPYANWCLGPNIRTVPLHPTRSELNLETGDGVVYRALLASAREAGATVVEQEDPLADLRQLNVGGVLDRRSGGLWESQLRCMACTIAYADFIVREECGRLIIEFKFSFDYEMNINLCRLGAARRLLEPNVFVSRIFRPHKEIFYFNAYEDQYPLIDIIVNRREAEFLRELRKIESPDWRSCSSACSCG